MPSVSVVKCFYILKHRVFGLIPRFIFILINKLGFQSFEKTLRYSIVIAISFSTHTSGNVLSDY